MLCEMLEKDGWTSAYLGATVPTESLLDMLRERQPDVLALSITINPHLPRLRNIIQTVREALGDETPHIIVGGRPFLENPEMAKRVGADSMAKDAREATTMLKNVVAMRRQAG
jgi:methanogenic corrinoid protein MtbC1